MNVLLDTHSFLWFVEDDPQLSPFAKSTIENPLNEVYVSVASAWEIAIKVGLGKLKLSMPFRQFIKRGIEGNDFVRLDVSIDHCEFVQTLPFHHRDPFDRMLIAQTLVERMSLVSIDSIDDAYGCPRIW